MGIIRLCMLASGSSGNAIYIECGGEHLLLDAGLSGREIAKRLAEIGVDPKKIQTLLLSHEHQDHIRGAGVLSRRMDIPIVATAGTWKGSERTVGSIAPKNRIIMEGPFSLGEVDIQPFPLSHDAREPVGFILEAQGIRLGIATDVGMVNESMLLALQDCHLVILEANHDLELLKMGPYPPHLKERILSPIGHLSNDDAGYAASILVESGVSHIILGHLSETNNHPALAYHTVKNTLESQDIIVGKDLQLSLVEHMALGGLVQVG